MSCWRDWPLDILASVAVSTVDKKQYEGEVPVRLCNYTDVYYNDLITGEIDFMEATATSDQIERFSVRAGDVVITKDSETSDDIGRPAFVPNDLPGVVYGYHLAVYRPFDARYGRYLRYVFDSTIVRSELARRTPGVTRVGLSQDTLRNLRVPAPCPDEASLIADYLDHETSEIDAFIADLRGLVALAHERLLGDWSELFQVASQAPSTQVRHIVSTLVDGPFGSALTSDHYSDSGAPVVRLGNIGRFSFGVDPRVYIPLSYAQQLSSHSVGPGDVVIAGLGDESHPLGRAAVVPVEFGEGIVKADCYRARVNGLVTPDYLAWALSSPQSADRFQEVSRGSTRSRLNLGLVAASRIPVPDLDDQQRLVNTFKQSRESVAAAVADINAAISLASERRAALITAAVTGQIDVTERQRPVVDSIQTAIEEAR